MKNYQTANAAPAQQLFTTKGLAKHLGITVTTLNKFALPRIVLGHRTKLVLLDDALAAIQKLKKGGTP